MSLKLMNRLLLQPCVLNQPKNLLFLGEESCFLILLLFAQVIGFAVSHQYLVADPKTSGRIQPGQATYVSTVWIRKGGLGTGLGDPGTCCTSSGT